MIIALIVVLLILILASFMIGDYFCNIALNPKVSKNYILRNVTEEGKKEEYFNNKNGERWLQEFASRVNIISEDDLKLNGYEVINPMKKSETWVILVHGYMGCAYEMVQYAKQFINMGYNVLLIDLRAHGKSEGKYIGMGWKDRLDLKKWIDKLCFNYPNCNIILYGVSMGAATVMMTSGEKLPNNVKICIEDCGYSSVLREFKLILKILKPYIADYIINVSSFVAKIKAGYSYKDASSIKQVIKSDLPTLFIHGEKDTFVAYEMLDEIYEAANSQKEKLVIKNAGHAECSKINPTLYWNTIKKFIEQNMVIN